jgi:mannitol/fructose-specific phosphotransferase system IIA component (Ntr-type)
LLQEKILQKEGVIVELEKQLTDREELIRELAEKLITANMEREEIFSEY